MNFSEGPLVPEGPGGADDHHVALHLGNCVLWISLNQYEKILLLATVSEYLCSCMTYWSVVMD